MESTRAQALQIYEFERFTVETLVVKSRTLKANPLKDPATRYNPVLVPKKSTGHPLPVVLVLAGFTGNGPKYFSPKPFESNLPEIVDACAKINRAPHALYVFVDAFTKWGGSQFINSKGTGRYEDYIIQEIVTAVKEHYDVSHDPDQWCVTGGSSGGYGALHLASRFPDKFGLAAAIAPDSFFEASLLPDIYKAIPTIEALGGVNGVKRLLDAGEFMRRRDSHVVLNAIGMACCYSATANGKPLFPVDFKSGELLPQVWKKWKAHDPLVFLAKRKANLKKLKGIWLDVGIRDQYNLQFGARQIKQILKSAKAPLTYSEFDGTHFDIGDRRPQVWAWLKKQWA